MNADLTYRKFASFFDLYMGDFVADVPVYKSFCQPHEPILEVGSGTGCVLQHFVTDAVAITGVDISQEMLDVAGTQGRCDSRSTRA